MSMFKFFNTFSQEGRGGDGSFEDGPQEERTVTDEYIVRQVAEFMRQREQSSETYKLMLNELDDFAAGQGDELIKRNIYPAWTRADFRALRAAVEAAERAGGVSGTQAA